MNKTLSLALCGLGLLWAQESAPLSPAMAVESVPAQQAAPASPATEASPVLPAAPEAFPASEPVPSVQSAPVPAAPAASASSAVSAPAQPVSQEAASAPSAPATPATAPSASATSAPLAPTSTPAQPVSTSSQAPAKEVPAQETPAQESASSASPSKGGSGVSFGGAVSVGTMTLDGKQVNRVSYRPELSIGSLGVAFDIELFVNSQGQPMDYGWQFDTRDEIISSLYRKIYYVRWNQPGDGFYVRAGALENINMDAAGLVASGFGNVANYPGQKLVGVHLQLNDFFDPLGVSLEAVNNSLEDWSHGGGVIGGKLSFKPLGPTGIPVVRNLRLGGIAMVDINQLATVRDRDGDHCPDQLDDAPRDAKTCSYLSSYLDPASFERLWGNADSLSAYLSERNAARVLDESAVKNRFGTNDAFTLWGVDYLQPLLRLGFLDLDLYGEWARPYVNDEVDSFDLNESWGLVPVGASLRFSILKANLEYRQLQGRFVPSHFNSAYEMERVRFINGAYVTKEQSAWQTAEDPGSRKGVYGRAMLDLLGFVDIGGSYSHLWSEDGPADRSYTGSAGLGQSVLAFIPKLSKLEAFYGKEHVGREGDSFFARHTYTTHGYRVGFDLGANMTVIVTNLTTYTRDSEGSLKPQSNFLAETVLSF